MCLHRTLVREVSVGYGDDIILQADIRYRTGRTDSKPGSSSSSDVSPQMRCALGLFLTRASPLIPKDVATDSCVK